MASSTKSDDTCPSKYQDHDISADDEDEELFELDLALMDQVQMHCGYRDDDSKKEALLANCLMPVACISNAKPFNDLGKISVNASIRLSYRSATGRSRRLRSCEFWIGQPAKMADKLDVYRLEQEIQRRRERVHQLYNENQAMIGVLARIEQHRQYEQQRQQQLLIRQQLQQQQQQLHQLQQQLLQLQQQQQQQKESTRSN